jgi:O-antigen/teichoic acid export membrane protein
MSAIPLDSSGPNGSPTTGLAATEVAPEVPVDPTLKHIRGSGLLLAGRMVSLAINFAVNVLTVRLLTREAYGEFAYGLAFLAIATNLNLLGLGRAIAQVVPFNEERGESRRAVGAVLFCGAVVGLLGIGIAAAVVGFGEQLGAALDISPEAVRVLTVLVLLTPIQSVDNLAQGLAAALVGARALFFRRQLLGPLLKLAAVLSVMASSGSVRLLAWGYVLAGAIGLFAYVPILGRAFRKRGWLEPNLWLRPELRGRFLLRLGMPLLWLNVVQTVVANMAVFFLEVYRGPESVAGLRAVMPIAALVFVVAESFKLLYVPAASRLVARGDKAGQTELYWQSLLWIATLSFPIFAACFLLSAPLTVLLFGERYADAAGLLMVLSLGQFLTSLLTLNNAVLAVTRRGRLLSWVQLLGFLLALLFHWQLVPRLGALGAAIAVSLSLVVLNGAALAAVVWGTEIGSGGRSVWRTFGSLGAVLLGIVVLGFAAGDRLHPALALLAAGLASAVVLYTGRRWLRLRETFPELAKFRRWFLR